MTNGRIKDPASMKIKCEPVNMRHYINAQIHTYFWTHCSDWLQQTTQKGTLSHSLADWQPNEWHLARGSLWYSRLAAIVRMRVYTCTYMSTFQDWDECWYNIIKDSIKKFWMPQCFICVQNASYICTYIRGMWQYNVILSFLFGFVYTERSNRLNGRSISSVCLTACVLTERRKTIR